MTRSRTLALIFFIVVGSLSFALACDPNHDWKERDAFSRRLVGFQAAANLVEKAVEHSRFRGFEIAPMQKLGLLSIDDDFARVGVLDAKGETIRPRTKSEQAIQAGFMEQTAIQVLKDRKLQLVDRKTLQNLAIRWKVKGDWVYDHEFLKRAAKELNLVAFLKLSLQEYAQAVRIYRDAHPNNEGLWLIHTFSAARARVSVQRPDGNYVFIDEISSDGGNELLYFSESVDKPYPVKQIVQARSGRPGTQSANWQLYPERDHFK